MLGLNLNPWLTLGAFLAGLAAGSAASVSTYEKIIIPSREAAIVERVTKSVTQEQQIICRDTTNVAATAARNLAIKRQKQASDAALEAYRSAVSQREAARVTQIEKLEQENANYARQLVDQGLSCPLDSGTARWLRAPAANAEH